jgi:RNA polymerase sigma-70 factor (ECF subfamily)
MLKSALESAELALPGNSTRAVEREIPADLLHRIYGQMRHLAGPRADLDDLAQAAAERALKAWPRFEGRSAVSTWTYGIVYRTLLDHERWYRRWRRRFTASNESAGPEPRADLDPETASIEVARARQLHQALSRLAPAKRAVVVLRELEGLSLKEVAEVVGANERTVRSRLHDGKQKLLALLREDPCFNPEVPE